MKKIIKAGICVITALVLTGCSIQVQIPGKDNSSTEGSTSSKVESSAESSKTESSTESSKTESSAESSKSESSKTESSDESSADVTSSTTESSEVTQPTGNTAGLYDYTFQLDTVMIGLPCKVGEMVAQGWTPDKANSVIAADNIIFWMEKGNSDVQCVVKGSDRSQLTDDAEIISMQLDAECLEGMYAAYCNLSLGTTTQEDMAGQFGMPYSMDIDNNVATFEYYKVPGEMWSGRISFTFVDNKLQTFEVNIPQE